MVAMTVFIDYHFGENECLIYVYDNAVIRLSKASAWQPSSLLADVEKKE